MIDKKICANCSNGKICSEAMNMVVKVCNNWIRNPRLWLSISDFLPTVTAHYWWRGEPTAEPKVIFIHQGATELWTFDCIDYMRTPLSKLHGDLQGPISPNH